MALGLEDPVAPLACAAGADPWTCSCGPVQPLTSGPGNDTEPAWAPDGRRIAFQTDRAGDLDVVLLDLASGAIVPVSEGPGHACTPAWTPDGALLFAFGHHPMTAVQAADARADCGYGLRLWRDGGETRTLTRGYWRDTTPSMASSGGWIHFSSTRKNTGNGASLWRLDLRGPDAAQSAPATPGDDGAECVLPLDGASCGAMQPSLSPDGRFLLWAQLENFRGNWRLAASRGGRTDEAAFLTPPEMAAYAPRWSPDGRLIAFTGFRLGDPGWGIYLLEPRSGALARLDVGPGNSKSPAWSPDGGELVFENNRAGLYKLYRTRVTPADPPRANPPPRAPVPDRVEARLESGDDAPALVARDGRRVPGARARGASAVEFADPPGLDFGAGPFFVRVTLVADALREGPQIAAVGSHAEHRLGWQIFLRETGKVHFNSRDPRGQYIGVESDVAVALGKPVTALGIRDPDGGVRLYVDGRLQSRRGAGATMAYGPASKVCLGRQWNGGMHLDGKVLAFECGRGYPPGVPPVSTRESLFAGEER